jgi:hypothetical protein
MPDKNGKPYVIGIISMPRLSMTNNMFCAMAGFSMQGIPLAKWTGAYWHHGIDQLLTSAIEQNFDYAITTDYDSIYTPRHVRRLVELMMENRDATAIFGVQVKRDTPQLLYGRKADDGSWVDEVPLDAFACELTQADAGHFGLTAFDLTKLRTLAKPWLIGQPDEHGGWGKGSTHPDVYFWRHLGECGHTFYQANNVRVGHIEQSVTFPDNKLGPSMIPMSDVEKNGMPPDVTAALDGYTRQKETVNAG